MSAEQWKTVWEIYQQARDAGVDERTAYVESLTADPDIAREVISLLDAYPGPHLKNVLQSAQTSSGAKSVED